MQSGFQLIAKDHVILQSFDNAVRLPRLCGSVPDAGSMTLVTNTHTSLVCAPRIVDVR